MILFLLECQIETWGDCECVFPFKYNGVLYNSCTDVDEGQLWCVTDVNEDQEMKTGTDYGWCREPVHTAPGKHRVSTPISRHLSPRIICPRKFEGGNTARASFGK